MCHAIPLTARRDAHSGMLVSHKSRQIEAPIQTGEEERKPPLSEAHITQKTHPRPTSGGSRQIAPDLISKHPNEIHPQAARSHIAPDSAIFL